MDSRFEEVLKKLSPAQRDALLQSAEAMAANAGPRGARLKLDWQRSIDSEHGDGLAAQAIAMSDWARATERGLDH
jgi:hypothetical protein